MPAIRGADSKSKTRRRRRDLDQVYSDLRDPRHLELYKETKAAEDLPALGEFYCIECSRWFEAEHNLKEHKKGKVHKRRLRQLKDEPYTQKEAELAAGLRTDNGRPEKVPMDVDDDDDEMPDPRAALVTGNTFKEQAAAAQEVNDEEEYEAFFDAYQKQ